MGRRGSEADDKVDDKVRRGPSAVPERAQQGIGILLVSDSGMDRAAILDVIGTRLPAAVVRFARSLAEALPIARSDPSTALVLLSDNVLRQGDGGEIGALRAALPDARLAAFGAIGGQEAAEWARRGLDGILSRRLDPNRFGDVLQFLLDGNRCISPEVFAAEQANGVPCAFLGRCGRSLPLLDDLPVMLMLVHDGVVVYANRTAESELRQSQSELVGRRFSSLFAPSQERVIEAALAAAGSGEVPPWMLLALPQGENEARWIEARWSRAELAGSPALGCICLDVTDRVANDDAAQPACLAPSAEGAAAGDVAPDALARRLAQSYRGLLGRLPADGRPPGASPSLPRQLDRLTARQREVLALLAHGRANKEIAAQLGITEATVKLHVHHILRTLKLNNRTEAALAGRQLLSTS